MKINAKFDIVSEYYGSKGVETAGGSEGETLVVASLLG